nr:hypothetical protein [Tanacetum cinerariifolium]
MAALTDMVSKLVIANAASSAGSGTLPECLKIIESKSKVRQSRAKAVVAKVSRSSSTPAISSYVDKLKDMVKALLLDKKNQSPTPTPSTTPAPFKAVKPNCVQPTKTLIETTFKSMCRKQPQQVTIKETPVSDLRWLLIKSDPPVFLPIRIIKTILIGEIILIKTEVEISTSLISTHLLSIKANFIDLWTLPGNSITNPKEELKGITTRSGVAYQGPKTPSPSKQGTKSQASVSETVVAPVGAPMPNLKPSIPYPSRRDNEKRRDQANEQIEKFYEIFKETSFEISFTDALTLMPKFASTLKALIGNKEKLNEMARTPTL